MVTKLIFRVFELALRRFHVLALGRQGYAQAHAFLTSLAVHVRHFKQTREQIVKFLDAALDVFQNHTRALVVLIQPIHHSVDLIEQSRTPRCGLGQVLRRIDSSLDLPAQRVQGSAQVNSHGEQHVRHRVCVSGLAKASSVEQPNLTSMLITQTLCNEVWGRSTRRVTPSRSVLGHSRFRPRSPLDRGGTPVSASARE